MHLPEGTILQNGKYKIVRFISSGGFGCTYEGELTAIGAKVAIKEFFPSDICNREYDSTVSVGTKSKEEDFIKLKRSFMKEASVLFKMQNPHIVRVTDVFEENGTAYYVMDYIDGPSLAQIVKQKGKLSESEAVGYIRQVCEALKYVHSQNRMHMDIKPGNIMVDNNGKAILIDFGASKYYDEQTGEQTSTNVGTYTNGFAPVEQVSRTLKTFNPATDIYALGATLYKLLTGVTPPNSMALMTEAETLQPLPLTISEPTRKAVESAMQLKDKNRPKSIEEFERILKKGVVKPDFEKTYLDPNPINRVGKESSTSPKEVSQEKKDINSLKSENRTISKKVVNGPISNNGTNRLPLTKIFIGVCSIIVLVLICFFINGSKSDSGGTNEVTGGTINGHDWVDLGLPSGIKWATCNVGATSPEDYGNYFSWGGTQTKEIYYAGNCETWEKENPWLRNNNFIESNGTLSLSHDAAHQIWGGSWRMPTMNEIDELVNNTTAEVITRNGVMGLLFKSKKNDNNIFLPAAGRRYNTYSLIEPGQYGGYWSSTYNENDSRSAYHLYFASGGFASGWNWRIYGFSVRPVAE